ncbi:response regulator [Nesterenkonia xinjiangensis]|uniref:DNA-binding NarL/FixJ family response regulator n=1 Tax=Nesterenkonia xinjiangensis TaxID=225327 RepID=A0A7Z0KBY6_9MICC|nr:response regulator transcription factor [Nesterenkonia xinjiangensis]NYJ78097.1 DNA-binding NarL/FixJ family response regulator [Nesterenkonia xinjiangensis]
MTTTGVLLADDQALLRAGFAMVIDSQPDMQVLAQAGDGQQALEAVATHAPDVVLMDIRMPVLDGLEATRRLTSGAAGRAAPKIIVLTTFDTDEYAVEALRAGASGFLLKDVQPEILLDSIRTVTTGGAVIAPTTTRRLLDSTLLSGAGRRLPTAAQRAKLDSLTAREAEILQEMATGDSNGEIARRLFLSEATVKTHVGHVLTKLEVRDRVQAVVFAYDSGLVGD